MLVTAILPTLGRPDLATRALDCILAQTCPAIEVLVLDDDCMPSFPNGLDNAGVGYVRADKRWLGDKLNLACGLANGEYIVHFHDDDYSAPERIADQVELLAETGKSVTIYRNLRFSDGVSHWRQTNWPGGFGMALCHRRDWALAHPFPSQGEEDWPFVAEAMRANQFAAGEAADMMTVHLNVSSVIGPGWEKI